MNHLTTQHPELSLRKRVQVTNDRHPKKLDGELIQRIFAAYGESDLAADHELHQQMIQIAAESSNSRQSDDELLLDLETFGKALTNDIQLYDIKNEARATSNLDDVLLTKGVQKIQKSDEIFASLELNLEDIEARQSKANQLVKIQTAPAIDYTAGTYRSKHLIIFLYATGKYLRRHHFGAPGLRQK